MTSNLIVCFSSTSITLSQSAQGIIYFSFDRKNKSQNLLDDRFIKDYLAAVSFIQDREFTGVILTSTKQHFFVGGDLDALAQMETDDAEQIFQQLSDFKAAMRWLETCAKPVVACLHGAALGSGWEMALASHHRIALASRCTLGLPEVSYGLMPSAGGVVRMTRILGLQLASNYLLKGKMFTPQEGLNVGLIDLVVESQQQLIEQAEHWINKQKLPVQQVFDRRDFIQFDSVDVASRLNFKMTMPALLIQKTQGLLPAPEAILAVMVEGLKVDIETALRIESRYFVSVLTNPIAKNKLNLYWRQLNEVKSGASRPHSIAKKQFTKVGVLGAGMMGAGIAYTLASHGIDVVLKDVSLEKAVFAKSYTATILGNSNLSDEAKSTIINRIQPSKDASDFIGCELIIEAVFEDRELKASVTKEAQAAVSDQVLFASNTSTLPITGLAQASVAANKFIGMHFFSPVDKMPLVEIIRGEQTDDETLAAIYDLTLQIGKTPIVVNDSRGFFTSRVFTSYVYEGMRLLAQGIAPARIENAAIQAGFPVGPLALIDEVSVTLLAAVRKQTENDLAQQGQTYIMDQADFVIDAMIAAKRLGKSVGCGFYSYPSADSRAPKHLWQGLTNLIAEHLSDKSSAFALDDVAQVTDKDIQDRLLYVQVLESLRAYNGGVVLSQRDANVGSIMGLGFPSWTGGVLQFIKYTGVEAFIQRAKALSHQGGPAFICPDFCHDEFKHK